MDIEKVGSFIKNLFWPDDPGSMGMLEILLRLWFYTFLILLCAWVIVETYCKIKRVRKIYKRGLALEARKKNNLKLINGDDDVKMKLLNNSNSRKIEILPKGQNQKEKSKDNNVDDAETKPLTSKSKEIEVRPKVQTLNEKSKTFIVDGLDLKPLGSQSITLTVNIKGNTMKSEESGFSTHPIGDVSMLPPTIPPLSERPRPSLLLKPAYGDVSMPSSTVTNMSLHQLAFNQLFGRERINAFHRPM